MSFDTADLDRPLQPVHRGREVTVDRQVLAFGQLGQSRISEARIAVVGAGGTGSAVLEQLARLGANHVWIIDPDTLELSNVSRVYGSTSHQALNGSPKAQVAAQHFKSINPDAHVKPLIAAFPTEGLMQILPTMDIVFGCTDNHASRGALNDLAYKCLVPVIDIGCLMAAKDGNLLQSLCRVRVLQPGLPCLWCTDSIDGRRIVQESLSSEERARLASEGYGLNLGPQPSVIQLTTLAAGLAINEFLRLVAWAGHPYDGTEIIVDLEEGTMMKVTSHVTPKCRCLRVTGLGAEVLPA